MTDMNIDDLLDSTLDDLEDLPEFKPFPAGVHRAMISLDFKEVNGKQVIELEMKALETMELSDPAKAEPLKEGDTTSIIFMLDNEFGRGNLKKIATPIATALGTGSIRETVEGCKDVEAVLVTALRADKNDKDKFYTNVKELQVV